MLFFLINAAIFLLNSFSIKNKSPWFITLFFSLLTISLYCSIFRLGNAVCAICISSFLCSSRKSRTAFLLNVIYESSFDSSVGTCISSKREAIFDLISISSGEIIKLFFILMFFFVMLSPDVVSIFLITCITCLLFLSAQVIHFF